jgi:hypothetical protein
VNEGLNKDGKTPARSLSFIRVRLHAGSMKTKWSATITIRMMQTTKLVKGSSRVFKYIGPFVIPNVVPIPSV